MCYCDIVDKDKTKGSSQRLATFLRGEEYGKRIRKSILQFKTVEEV